MFITYLDIIGQVMHGYCSVHLIKRVSRFYKQNSICFFLIKDLAHGDSTNGYLCQFEVFVGKESSTVERQQEPQPRADRAIATVVRRLTRSLVGKNYFAFMDNFFASVFLFQELLCENIYCCGTVRSNHKGFPAMLKGVNLKEQGDSKFA